GDVAHCFAGPGHTCLKVGAAIGAAVAVGLVCGTGVGCLVLAGAASGALSGALSCGGRSVAGCVAKGAAVGALSGLVAGGAGLVVGKAVGALAEWAVPDAALALGEQGEAAAAEAGSATPLTDLADEVRTSGLHPAAVNQRTIAVGADSEGSLFAGSSNGFDAGQRAALERLGI